jgi:hypothetical protein
MNQQHARQPGEEEEIFLNFLMWERIFPQTVATHSGEPFRIKELDASPGSA